MSSHRTVAASFSLGIVICAPTLVSAQTGAPPPPAAPPPAPTPPHQQQPAPAPPSSAPPAPGSAQPPPPAAPAPGSAQPPPPAAPAPGSAQPGQQKAQPPPASSAPAPQPQQPAPAAEDQSSNEEALPFYVPPEDERFKKPPAPLPPEPPAPSLMLGAYFQTHSFVASDISGTTTELGARIGPPGVAFALGALPGAGMLALGLTTPRLLGAKLADLGPSTQLTFHGPTFDAKIYTDFSDNTFVALGASAIGLGFATCGAVPFYAQLRGPYFHLWIPAKVGGNSLGDARAAPQFSLGSSLEAGIMFY